MTKAQNPMSKEIPRLKTQMGPGIGSATFGDLEFGRFHQRFPQVRHAARVVNSLPVVVAHWGTRKT